MSGARDTAPMLPDTPDTPDPTVAGPVGAEDEVSMLVAQLHATDRRLEELLGTEVDSVTDRQGRTMLLRHAQDQRRLGEIARQAAILNALPYHIALLDSAGTIVSMNQAWRDFSPGHWMLGPFHGLGMNFRDALAGARNLEAIGPRAATAIAQVLAGDRTDWAAEYPLDSHTEGRRWFRFSVTPLSDGLVNGVVVVHADITAQKQADAAALESAELLRAVIAGASDAIFVKNREGRYILCNPAFASFFGHTVASASGLDIGSLVGEARARPMMEIDRQVLHEGRTVTTEDIATNAAGRESVFLTTRVPHRRADGAIVGIIGVCHDITALKRDQESLNTMNAALEARVESRTAELETARSEAETANRAKASFLATMSHELRTPMNGVIGMLDVLHQTPLDKDQLDMVDLMSESAFALLEIVDDVLDFSKIEAGKLTVENLPMGVGDVIEKVCALLDEIAQKRQVQVSIHIDPQIPESLIGDAGRLRQVMVNLLGNAIKFSSSPERAGRVSVRAVLVDRDASGATVEITVDDDGIGMDPETVARLFKPFSQGSDTTARKFEGTGLGLAISAMLVSLMGGTLSVRSQPNNGSVFTVRLRLTELASAYVADELRLDGVSRCRIVGDESPLRHDLAAAMAGFVGAVAYSDDLAAACALPRESGSELWILLPGERPPVARELSTLVHDPDGKAVCFVLLGWGKRRRPRIECAGLVHIDLDALSRRQFHQAIEAAAGWSPVRAGTQGAHPLQVGKGPSGAAPPARVLVAEDNEISRQVIARQIELLGYEVDVVKDGAEAFEKWRLGSYGLLVTDVHMPSMDGYKLSTAIRAEEAGRASAGPMRPRTPILALSGNVLREDLLRCFAAGMDSYLSKPIRMSMLKTVLVQWIGLPAEKMESFEAVEPAASNSTTAPGPVLDVAVLRALVGDSPEVVDRVLRSFKSSAAASVDVISMALAVGDWQLAGDAAHSLKSGARSVGALGLAAICVTIEAGSSVGEIDAAALQGALNAELRAIADYVDPGAPSSHQLSVP